MQKFSILLLVGVFWFGLPSLALAERIISFDTIVRVNQAGDLLVTETIQYDFGEKVRHGIFRRIPYLYDSATGQTRADIDSFAVSTNEGESLPFTESRDGGFVRLKIGDPEVTTTGIETYTISYTVHDAVLFLEDRDEIYWNLTGNDWPLPIEVARGVFVLGFPEATIVQSACYAGAYGSQRPCEASATSSDGRTLEIGQRLLGAKEGLSVAVAFPKGLLTEPSSVEKTQSWLLANWIVAIPLGVVLLMMRLWYVRGRDPRGRGVIVRQYDAPETLSPLATGLLIDEVVHNRDVTAQLIDLAVKGYLKIHQVEKQRLIFSETDYELERLKYADETLSDIDRKLLEKIFDETTPAALRFDLLAENEAETETAENQETENARVALSDLKHKLTSLYQQVGEDINAELTWEGYFVRNPQSERKRYITAGLIGGFVSLWVVGFFGLSQSLVVYGSIVVAGLSVVGFGYFMPQRTKKGVQMREYILGLKEYLSVAEADRLAFHNDPEKTPERFDALLPYAMVLGVEKEWAKKFAEIYEVEPHWFDGGGARFNPAIFATDMKGFTQSMQTAAAPKSSGGSSGGGFSGGGFGGGGGGSW